MLKKKIEKLITLIENTEIEEIEVSSFWGAQKIRLSKSKNNQNIIIPQSSRQEQELATTNISLDTDKKNDDINKNVITEPSLDQKIADEDDYEDESRFNIIKAPLVGTFYSSPKPEDPAFVSIGESVNIGKVVCIIEAMKIFNDIESEFDGELVHVYIENGTPVEYGQELFVLRIKDV